MIIEAKVTTAKLDEGIKQAAVAEVRQPEIEEVQPEKQKPRQRKAKPHPLEGKVVRGSGPAYWLIENGKRRLIPNMAAFYAIGLQIVEKLSDEVLRAIPEGKPLYR